MTKTSYRLLALTSLLMTAFAVPYALAQEKTTPDSAPAFLKERRDQKGDEKRMSPEERFKKDDTNSDGFLSKDEMLAAHKARIDQIFERLDADGNDKLSPEEMKKGRDDFREKMKQRREKMKERHQDDSDGPDGPR